MCTRTIKLPNTKWVRNVIGMGGWHEYTNFRWLINNNNKQGTLYGGFDAKEWYNYFRRFA
jgi:hypothetical protein